MFNSISISEGSDFCCMQAGPPNELGTDPQKPVTFFAERRTACTESLEFFTLTFKG